ncbi:hypothetical protein C4B63_57g118 [Trypanosoma cruzi]|uniref:Uncharacterized protein n=1 Tax=Trypanosoma cruzi TaxID=5693 RepID=A0A2V2UZL1_TRYCR|nr:hypothetical protein C4B63_57g118 [Trypanosoma cruzi]
MHSPYEAVYGFDRTHIRRMTLQEYMSEKDAPAAGSSLRRDDGCRLLISRDPNVEFCTKYPVHDRFGRELCVLYQILEMELQQEIRRVEQGGDGTRKSGVRLSTEITLDDDPVDEPFNPRQREERDSAYHPTPFVHTALADFNCGDGGRDDDNSNVDVSASSYRFSSTTALSPGGKGSCKGVCDARGSSFSIYRESGLNATAGLLQQQQGTNRQQLLQQQGLVLLPMVILQPSQRGLAWGVLHCSHCPRSAATRRLPRVLLTVAAMKKRRKKKAAAAAFL